MTAPGSRQGRIIEVALLRHDGRAILEEFQTLVHPGGAVPAHVTRTTGLGDLDLRHAPPFHAVARQLVGLTRGTTLVAHDARLAYTHLRQEFASLGYDLRCERLCTMRLARQLLPDRSGYQLGELCCDLRLPHEDRRRALGRARATTHLLAHLLQRAGGAPWERLRAEAAATQLPPHLSLAAFEALPDATGVYHLLGEDDLPLYVGKSRSIRHRVLAHVTRDRRRSRFVELARRIRRVTFELTGSELVALLVEAARIRELQPPFNRAFREATPCTHAILHSTDPEGFVRLQVAPVTAASPEDLTFPGPREAHRVLDSLVRRHRLCDRLCHRYPFPRACPGYETGRCLGACAGREPPSSYNRRVAEALGHAHLQEPGCIILGPGREPGERSAVLVEGGAYRGHGWLPVGCAPELAEVQARVEPGTTQWDARRILRRWLRHTHPDHERLPLG